jgi:hypothetical protein
VTDIFVLGIINDTFWECECFYNSQVIFKPKSIEPFLRLTVQASLILDEWNNCRDAFQTVQMKLSSHACMCQSEEEGGLVMA